MLVQSPATPDRSLVAGAGQRFESGPLLISPSGMFASFCNNDGESRDGCGWCTGPSAVPEDAIHGGVELTLEEPLGLAYLPSLLEGAAQEGASLLALLAVARFLQDGVNGLLYPHFVEGDAGQVRDDLPDLTVHKVRLPGVDPRLARAVPRPALHADGVLYVLVFQAVQLHPVAVRGYELGLYADLGGHGASLAAGGWRAMPLADRSSTLLCRGTPGPRDPPGCRG